MSVPLTVVSLFPELLNVNGDSANAIVLETRARWSGFETRLARVRVGEEIEWERPDIVVIGSGSDEDLPKTLSELRRIESCIRDWVANDTPLLAVGTGWELLSDYIDTGTQPRIEGLGVFSGHSTPARERITSELVVDSDFGRLFGFENHARHYTLGTEGTPLGTVTHGSGNGLGTGRQAVEGSIVGNAVGTHLHGPVLARNPALADHFLSIAQARSTALTGAKASVELFAADKMAQSARAVVAKQLGITAEK